jgi:hypothetical protein
MVCQWFGFKTTGTVSFGLASKPVPTGFPSSGLKIDSYDLVIWASKSLRRFLSLGLKTKWTTVYQLRYKTDCRMKMAWGTHWDLAVCFMWKQVRLRFLSLASRLVEVWRQVVHVAPLRRSRENQVKDGWINATGSIGPCNPYLTVFFILDHRGICLLVFCLGL